MYCEHCGNELEEGEIYCPICGTKIPESNVILNEEHHVDKQNTPKKKKRVIIPILIIIVSLGALGAFIYFSIFGQAIAFSDMDKNHVYGLDFGKSRSYSEEDLSLTFDIDIHDLNGYVSNRNIRNNIEYGDIHIDDIAFSSRLNRIYIRGTSGDLPAIDIEADYSMAIKEDGIYLELTYIKGGYGMPVMNIFALNPFIQQEELIIPLETLTDDDLHLAFIMDMIENVTPNIDIRNSTLKVSYPLNGNTYVSNESIYPVDEAINIKTIKQDDTKYFDLTQADAIGELLKGDTALVKQFDDLNYTGEVRVDEDGKVLLRCKDPNSSLIYDVKLSISALLDDENIEASIDSLSLYNKTYVTLDDTNTYVASLNDKLEDLPLTQLSSYNVTDVEKNNQLLRFYSNQSDWTIMVYMNGSDLESYYDAYYGLDGFATEDLEEMTGYLDSDNIQVIVETGGTSEWKNQAIDPSQNQRWEIKDNELNHLVDLGMQNMTDPETLESFVTWSIETYPADQYALIMWNHGGGSIYGFGYDEYYYDDSLTVDELATALDGATAATGENLEVVGFDACLMATLETAVALEPYANYLIASEELEPGIGWDYSKIMETLSTDSASNGKAFGEIVTSGFVAASVKERQDETITLSVIDLGVIPDVVGCMDTLIGELSVDIETDAGYREFATIIPQVKAFGGSSDSIEFYDHFDLENFSKKLVEFYPNEANDLIAAIDDAVIYKSSGYLSTDAGGISFYLPYYNLEDAADIADIYAPVSFSDSYTDFATKFVDYHLASQDDEILIDYEYVLSEDVYDPYQIEVDPNDLDYISNIYLGVYIIDSDDTVIDLGMDALVFETESNNIYEEGFYSWPTLGDDYLPIYIAYESDEFIEYETQILLNGEEATMISAWIKDEGRYEIFGARPNDQISENGALDRDTISFEAGDVITPIYTTTDYYTGVESTLEGAAYVVGDTPPEMVDGDFQTGYSYGLQFVFVDYNNDYHYTDPLEFDYIE